MVPDIEREWIAGETWTIPPPGRWLFLVLLLLGIAGLLYTCSG